MTPSAHAPALHAHSESTPAFREQVGTDEEGEPRYESGYIFDIETISWSEISGSDPERTYIDAEINLHLTAFGEAINAGNWRDGVSYVENRFAVYPTPFGKAEYDNLQREVNAILQEQFAQLDHINVRGNIEQWLETTADGQGTLYLHFEASYLTDPEGWEQPGIRVRFGGFSSHWSLSLSLGQASDTIEESVFGPNADWVAYVSRDGNCYIHEVGGTWPLLETLSVGSVAVGLDVSPDGAYIATVDNDGECQVWDTSTWTTVQTFTDAGTNYARGVSFSRDSSYLGYPLNSGAGYGARVVNTADWSTVADLTDATLTSRGMGWSDAYIGIASRDNNVYVYDITDWSLVQTVTHATDRVEEATFSQDGAYMAIGGYDMTVRLVDTSDWSEVHTIASHERVMATTFDYNDSWLAYGTRDPGEAAIHSHDPASGWPEEMALTDVVDRCYAVTFSQSGQWFAAGEYSSPFNLHIYEGPAATVPVSGTVTLDGTALSGAKITAINDTQGTIQGVATTDANGAYSIECPVGETIHVLCEYDDGTDQYNDESKPFIVTQ